MTCFGILGGDRRQLYLARSLREDGHPVSLCVWKGGRAPRGFPSSLQKSWGSSAK